MAKYFRVTNAQGASQVQLDSQGRGTAQYTAQNVSAAPIDGRAVLVSLPPAQPASNVVQKGWVRIDGSADRHFNKDQVEVFVVKIQVPPGSPAGKYAFRLDVVSVARPDEGDEGPVMEFTVVASDGEGRGCKPNLLLIILAIVLVLIVGGVMVWLLTRKHTTAQTTPPPADACKQGYVWRQVVPTDHVCVTEAVHAQVVADNQQAPSRRNPAGGPYGPDTCLQGYVWRDALANDHVCVTGDTRSQAAADNAQAASRRAQP